MINVRFLRTGAGLMLHGRGVGPDRPAPRGLPDHPHPPHMRGRGLGRLWHFATEYLLALPLGAAIALVWANTAPESYFRTAVALEFFVSDIAMVFFFALITKEVVEATAPGGVLHSWRRAMLPIVGALGVAILPAVLFSGIATELEEPRIAQGWPAVIGIDLALGYFVARVIFGRHPVFPFFLLLAIAANGFAFLALAVQSAAGIQYGPLLLLIAGATAAGLALRRARVRSFWPYVVIAGGLSWCALYFGGFHPALALVPIIPFLPHAPRDPGFFVDAGSHATDALSRFEVWARHPAQAALFLFGLVAAGVPLRALEAGTWTLPVAALIGKPFGLLLGLTLGLVAGLHLPHRVHWQHLTVVALISTVGFTMALFFATAAIGPGPVLSMTKMGALLTLGGALLALAAARVLRVGLFTHPLDERK